MEQLQWQIPDKGYEAWLPLDFLPPDSKFLYRSSNNMSLIEQGSAICSPGGFHCSTQSQDVIVVGNVKKKDYILIGAARISAAAGILTGVSLTSDHLGRITPERMALLECAGKYRLKNPQPAGWNVDRWPRVFTGSVDGKNGAIFVNDSGREIRFVFSEFGLPDVCCEKLIGLGEVSGEIVLPPHDAAFVVSK